MKKGKRTLLKHEQYPNEDGQVKFITKQCEKHESRPEPNPINHQLIFPTFYFFHLQNFPVATAVEYTEVEVHEPLDQHPDADI